jgi:hypothetical protein
LIILHPKLTLWGEMFSPSRAEEEVGLPLSWKEEPGEIAERGRHRGQPRPHGFAWLAPPEGVPSADRMRWLLAEASRHLAAYRRLGATVCKFHVDVLYWEQCNLCFEPELLAGIAALGVNFTITCYDKKPFEAEPESDR